MPYERLVRLRGVPGGQFDRRPISGFAKEWVHSCLDKITSAGDSNHILES